MSNHQAPEQLLGYLYQVRYALALLLENDDPDFQISIERFDDIAFSKDGLPKELIQLKHHVRRHGDLTNGSTDLWRTLKVWIDIISNAPNMLSGTGFFVITTAIAPDNSAAYHLKNDVNRNIESAYEILKKTCTSAKNKDHKKYHEAFLNAGETTVKCLLNQVYIVDRASNIIEVEKVFRKQIRYTCVPKHEDQICERLEGWWYRKAIEALCSDTPVFVTQSQVRSFIVSVHQEYSEDNLPIDIFDIETLQEGNLSDNEKIFFEQLKLISLGRRRMQIALRDYYCAFKQRANWVRNDLLYVNELEKYEQRLIDEWEHAFAAMEDDLAEFNGVIEDEKAKAGRMLFSDIEKRDIRIRPKCQEAFVMRGSFHMLANQLKVGWHIDFYNRLKKLLT